MGTSNFGKATGQLPSGGVYHTAESLKTLAATTTNAHTLLLAVSGAIAAPVTGTSGVGSMDRNVKTTLSASYATAVTGGL